VKRAISLAAALILASPALVTPALHAQVAVGDSLWRLGRTDEAAAAYRKALEQDRNSVRANFRLSQTLAWSSNIDSALVLLRAARERVPDDPDLLFTEATYLSWARRWPEALLRYDSLITAHPGNDFNYARIARARTLSWAGRLPDAEREYRDVLVRDPGERDALFGLGQVRAWSGDLASAAAQYTRLLADDPTEARVLIALAQVRLWQSRFGSARALADRAEAQDSANADLKELRRTLDARTALRVDAAQYWSEDSDRNRNQWQTVGARRVVGDGISLGASAGFLTATDPYRTSRRSIGELSVGMPVWRGTVSASAAVRMLDPAPLVPGDPAPPSRTVLSGRLSLQQRVASRLMLGASVARWPFDEIAVLMPLELDIDQWEGTVEWRATSVLTLSGLVGGLDYSDGNRRRSWATRAAHRVGHDFTVGAFVTGFTLERRAPRYFSPPHFTAGELTAGWSRESARWSGTLNGGVGAQRIDTLPTQSQWHFDARLGRQWGERWTVELFGGRSTSAAASAVGAYAYSTFGVSARRSF
jgi:tetratricopeptide (TPR) repeat protein